MDIDSDANDDFIGIKDTFSALAIHMNKTSHSYQLINTPKSSRRYALAFIKLNSNNNEENPIDTRIILSAVNCSIEKS